MSGRGSRTGSGSRRVFWTIGELAELSGVSVHRTRNVLEANDVKLTPGPGRGRNGKTVVVFKASLVERMPEWPDSLKLNGYD